MDQEIKDFNQADADAARSLQTAMMNAIYKQIAADPLGVSASLLAVAERMLARWNMGLIEMPAEEHMTAEEKEMIKEFEKLNMGLPNGNFDKLQ